MDIPEPIDFSNEDINVLDNFSKNYNNLIEHINDQNINSYMNFIVEQMFLANKYFNDQEPWKKKSDTKRLKTIIYSSLELIRKISILLYPIIPNTSLKVLNIFGIKEDGINIETIKNNKFLKPGEKINKIGILFNKVSNND